ncbi:CPBP family intramembrane glutamic endopeptidase [Thalassotalea psychrophila]|uniref:CPBP family intramembrane glutamic endopeptidase n=1 Tax=Thalassotalea psychrophila TaxID=3065647 RepID=A0ABY9TSF5_9GAMM|nr:CPBP family intramembrane glutamic endopeptidase [Colwelliaceae bacterium SQ149]
MSNSQELSSPNSYEPLSHAVLWIMALYVPTIFLSIIMVMYAESNPQIIDTAKWLTDGDVTTVFSILMAFFTLPLLAYGTSNLSGKQRFKFFALQKRFSFNEFKPWLMLTLVYIVLSYLINILLDVRMPEWMLEMRDTIDYGWLSLLSVCIIAPIFEELVFRGFIFSKIERTRLRKSGAVVVTAVIFTMIHTQYENIILADLFVLSLLLSFVRLKTNNLKYCIAIHMLNNMVSALFLFG